MVPPAAAASRASCSWPPPLTRVARSRALSRRAQDDKLPLHYAIERKASAEVVKLLLEKHPDGAKATNKA